MRCSDLLADNVRIRNIFASPRSSGRGWITEAKPVYDSIRFTFYSARGSKQGRDWNGASFRDLPTSFWRCGDAGGRSPSASVMKFGKKIEAGSEFFQTRPCTT
jgi:hypothetical protein